MLYLSALTCQELIEKLANLFNASPSVIVDIHLLGVNKIHILVNDEVVQNVRITELMFPPCQTQIDTSKSIRHKTNYGMMTELIFYKITKKISSAIHLKTVALL